jgi:hypothetical protein
VIRRGVSPAVVAMGLACVCLPESQRGPHLPVILVSDGLCSDVAGERRSPRLVDPECGPLRERRAAAGDKRMPIASGSPRATDRTAWTTIRCKSIAGGQRDAQPLA